MTAIYSIVSTFLCIDAYAQYAIIFLPVIPLQQLFGYAYWQTLLRYLAAFAITVGFLALIFILWIIGVFVYVALSRPIIFAGNTPPKPHSI